MATPSKKLAQSLELLHKLQAANGAAAIRKSDMMAAWSKKKPQEHIPVQPVEKAFSLANYNDPEGSEAACIVRSAKRESIFLFRIQNWLRFSPSCLPSAVCCSYVSHHCLGS
jgi:hypothetical protein